MPTDWFELGFDGPMHYSYAYPRQLLYRSSPVDVAVKFRNAGDKTLTAPTVRFTIKPSDFNGEPRTVVINGDGDGWACEITKESATCSSSAQVPPGGELPQIHIGVEFVRHTPEQGYTYDPFTATYGDVVYEGVIGYDTSV